MSSPHIERIHSQAQAAVAKFKDSEILLIEALEQCERFRVHSALGFSSLFQYATANLGLSEEVAYIYIKVARKTREVPALKTALSDGSITVSKAARLTRVLKPENQDHWLQMAKSSSKRQLEKLVASESPKASVTEKISYVNADRVEMTIGLSEKVMIQIRRAQDVISQKKRRPVGLEEVLQTVTQEYLRREDPLEKAERQMAKGKLHTDLGAEQGPGRPPKRMVPSKTRPGRAATRTAIPAGTRQRVYLKFQGQCAHRQPNGQRCPQRRFLDIHHRQPLAEGGTHDPANLELLCNVHHRARHG